MTTTCTNCGQTIKEIIWIDGKPYGTTCGSGKLGLNELPSWYKGGDWKQAKRDHEKSEADRRAEFQRMKKMTSEAWPERRKIAVAYTKARGRDDEWVMNFLSSIASQLGHGHINEPLGTFETMEEAEAGWSEWMGTFPYLYRPTKPIESLSDRQIEILEKYL